MNNKGLTVIELIMTIFIIGIAVINLYALIKYGNKPLTEMPIWLYWFLND